MNKQHDPSKIYMFMHHLLTDKKSLSVQRLHGYTTIRVLSFDTNYDPVVVLDVPVYTIALIMIFQVLLSKL